MPDIFVPTGEVKFSEKLVNGRYPVKVPSFMDVHEWWGNWETERFKSMEALLRPGMIFYDVGAFDGWQDAIISRFVGGGHNMVLIEPVAESWPNIKATWEANGVEVPLATYMGFIGPGNPAVTKHNDPLLPTINRSLWPKGPDYSKLIAVTKFKLLCEHADSTASIPLNDFIKSVPPPDAINIDVEGAELIVLRNSLAALFEYKPLVWLSVHPEFMEERYKCSPVSICTFMASLEYKGEFLGKDHEEHWLYRPL